jgi:Peptidase family M28
VTAASPVHERRRSRPGSLERPVNARLYRGTWLLVGFPLLLLAFSVARPPALQARDLPPAFDAPTAASLASDLASRYPDRRPGTTGDAGAARWFRGQLEPYGFAVRPERFTATIHGHRTQLVNLVAEKVGLSPNEIVVMAHRDDDGTGTGLNDNASGTAALVELARSYAPNAGAQRTSLPYSLAFVSTDGSGTGARGAAHFAAEPQTRQNALAVVNLDSIGGSGRPRILFSGDTARSPAPGLVETVRASLAHEAGADPAWPSGLQQLLGLAFPFSAYEQGPFVSRGIPAVTVTTGGARPPAGTRRGNEQLDVRHLGIVGLAAQDTVDAMEDSAGVSLAQGPASYVFLGQRLIRGWTIEIVLVAMLLPFLAAAVDLFARCRRRRISIAPALRSYRSRLGFWVWVAALFLAFGLLGLWGSGNGRPPSLSDVRWPAAALLVLLTLAGAGWLVARSRLLPQRPIQAEERLAGHSAALLALGVVGLLVAATNPFALVFVLPSLHAWLWLPQVQTRNWTARAAVLIAGFVGPAYLVWSFATHYGLGWDAPWFIAELFAVGYTPLPLLVIGIGWLAAAGQLAALSAGRYAPYPAPHERPRRGPLRELMRTLFLAQRRRAGTAEARRAVNE